MNIEGMKDIVKVILKQNQLKTSMNIEEKSDIVRVILKQDQLKENLKLIAKKLNILKQF